MTRNIVLNDVFTRLDRWKKYPNYRHECRADIYFALFLPDIMGLNCIDNKNNYDYIIPEFPLETERESNHTNKVDFAVIGDDTLYLIELKTCMGSLRIGQDGYLKKAQGTSPSDLIYYITKDLSKAPYASKKYNTLIDSLDELSPTKMQKLKKTKVVYIQPFKPKKNEDAINSGAYVRGFRYISFTDVKNSIKDTGPLATRFCDSLREWKDIEAETLMKSKKRHNYHIL